MLPTMRHPVVLSRTQSITKGMHACIGNSVTFCLCKHIKLKHEVLSMQHSQLQKVWRIQGKVPSPNLCSSLAQHIRLPIYSLRIFSVIVAVRSTTGYHSKACIEGPLNLVPLSGVHWPANVFVGIHHPVIVASR